ncbi:hypothetical protein AB0368_04995 [Actinoplanes sp. NPDC051475]|uniref:hypothetical protein n=1 Tax=Actinoplanes sp. NPDC051475 TaxID=3157225 RepID=UPI0034506FCE
MSIEKDLFPADDEPAVLSFLMARDDVEPTRIITPRIPATGAVGPYREQARARIAAAGWSIGAGIPDGGMAFDATRGGIRFAFHADASDGGLVTIPLWVRTVLQLAAATGTATVPLPVGELLLGLARWPAALALLLLAAVMITASRGPRIPRNG